MSFKETDAGQGKDALRQIPPVESLLNRRAIRALESRFGHGLVVRAIRQVLERQREEIRRDPSANLKSEKLEMEIIQTVESSSRPSLRKVINATGVVLHTNLGRAPLPREALEQVMEIASGYSNLEFDLEEGVRGKRDSHTDRLFRELLGAESTLVVNNNAAALFLTLNTLAEGFEVVVSRGELVEIGGSFRVPEICAKSGCILREIGTTNRTRVSDYARAINEKTRVILRVHPSNFRMVGFTERPEIEDLAALASRHGIALVEDLGSGCLTDLTMMGYSDEPTVGKSLSAGVDVTTFSGDKLLGGPQSGILLGKSELLARIRSNPLFRVLRVDKLTIAALEATIALYLREDFQSIPAQRMIRTTKQEITTRAEPLAQRVAALEGFSVNLCDGESVAGGGSTPGQSIPTTLIVISHAALSSQDLAQRLRRNDPPIIPRVERNLLLLDLRTVQDSEEEEILCAFQSMNN
ncbi:MAG TPA: L-seryl-tRNA(Sec) selenium transferase [Terriglobia bacterium]|nr:L-seryl-tRNA(Sec) selenium transferase [Terriglobia bacterium]